MKRCSLNINNELLRQELLEVKEREINQAKLHESMFNKVMNQTKTDPNEFIQKQLDVLKDLNTKEINDMKQELIMKNKKITDLSDNLAQANDKLNKADSDFMHKSREMELTIRELELHIKMLEEDKDRVETENTILVDELMKTEKVEAKLCLSKERKQSNPHEVLKSQNFRQLQNQIKVSKQENTEAIKIIDQLKSKSKKLKSNLQKAESVNNHNIMLLQTQFEKEHNKWEKDKNSYLQEIHILKRKTLNLTHLLQKYQHNEMLVNNSCWSCTHSHASNLQHRVPFGVINK